MTVSFRPAPRAYGASTRFFLRSVPQLLFALSLYSSGLHRGICCCCCGRATVEQGAAPASQSRGSSFLVEALTAAFAVPLFLSLALALSLSLSLSLSSLPSYRKRRYPFPSRVRRASEAAAYLLLKTCEGKAGTGRKRRKVCWMRNHDAALLLSARCRQHAAAVGVRSACCTVRRRHLAEAEDGWIKKRCTRSVQPL